MRYTNADQMCVFWYNMGSTHRSLFFNGSWVRLQSKHTRMGQKFHFWGVFICCYFCSRVWKLKFLSKPAGKVSAPLHTDVGEGVLEFPCLWIKQDTVDRSAGWADCTPESTFKNRLWENTRRPCEEQNIRERKYTTEHTFNVWTFAIHFMKAQHFLHNMKFESRDFYDRQRSRCVSAQSHVCGGLIRKWGLFLLLDHYLDLTVLTLKWNIFKCLGFLWCCVLFSSLSFVFICTSLLLYFTLHKLIPIVFVKLMRN